MNALQLALRTGRLFQKEQTGLIHYFPHSEDLVSHDTIPILENAEFAFTLLRTRLADHILEAKALLEKIFAFKVGLDFPLYLHQFPCILDTHLKIRLLPVFFWILHDFSTVLGPIKAELEKWIAAMGQELKKEDFAPFALRHLEALEGKISPLPSISADLGEYLVSLQIAEKKGASIDHKIDELLSTWNAKLSLYTGPSFRYEQRGYELEVTLYDLYMSQWHHHFAERLLKPHPLHLRASLIRPLSVEKKESSKENHSPLYTRFNADSEAFFFLGFEGKGLTHTLLLAKKHLSALYTQEKEGVHLLDLTLPEESIPDVEEGINLFLNHHLDHQLFINGGKATIFHLGDEITIRSKALLITLRFSLQEGSEGIFCGHLLRGNRPSQLSLRGENKFAAFDWKIVLRTISRQARCSLRLELSTLLQTQENQQLLPLHACHYPHTE